MLIPCAIGYGQIIVIVLVVILLFGGKKIPELMRGLGRGVKEFKDSSKEDGKDGGTKKKAIRPKTTNPETNPTPERPSNHTCSAAANK